MCVCVLHAGKASEAQGCSISCLVSCVYTDKCCVQVAGLCGSAAASCSHPCTGSTHCLTSLCVVLPAAACQDLFVLTLLLLKEQQVNASDVNHWEGVLTSALQNTYCS